MPSERWRPAVRWPSTKSCSETWPCTRPTRTRVSEEPCPAPREPCHRTRGAVDNMCWWCVFLRCHDVCQGTHPALQEPRARHAPQERPGETLNMSLCRCIYVSISTLTAIEYCILFNLVKSKLQIHFSDSSNISWAFSVVRVTFRVNVSQ